jgi:hypothetical protein
MRRLLEARLECNDSQISLLVASIHLNCIQLPSLFHFYALSITAAFYSMSGKINALANQKKELSLVASESIVSQRDL